MELYCAAIKQPTPVSIHCPRPRAYVINKHTSILILYLFNATDPKNITEVAKVVPRLRQTVPHYR